MSADENESQSEVREEDLDILANYSRTIDEEFEQIDYIIEDTFGSDRLHNNYDDYINTMKMHLFDIVDEADELAVTTALINTITQFDRNLYRNLKEKDEDLADNVKRLSNKYGLDVQRRIRRVQQGHNYWSNVKSDIRVRSSKPSFHHELIIDNQERLHFDSSASATAILSRHYLEQLVNAPDVLGEDVLSFIQIDEIERINELSDELLDKLEEYEPESMEPFAADEVEDISEENG